MKFKCLVLDHDDTVVDSTKSLHYPAFTEYLKLIRPCEQISLSEYFSANFDPGFLKLCREKYSFSENELLGEEVFWKNYIKDRIPKAYIGIKEILEEFKAGGGIICVVSHSFENIIKRDYVKNNLPLPDLIFGWDYPEEKRKPNTYPLFQIQKEFSLKKEDMLLIDDAKPGIDMAKNFGIKSAGALWANDITKIHEYLKVNADMCFQSVEELRTFFKAGI